MATTQAPHTTAQNALKTPFVNEKFVDFSQGDNRRAMQAALAKVRGELGREYDLVIGGRRVKTAEKIVSRNPARPAEVVGVHASAMAEHAEMAIAAAEMAFAMWSRRPMAARAELLFRAATMIRERKFEFCAWLTLEVGKNWAEADADVGETIDFLEFYAREALRLAAAKTPIQYPGELNELLYIPLGVGAVIPPWNFPFAIMAGMTAAAIVTGNTVVLKPSKKSQRAALHHPMGRQRCQHDRAASVHRHQPGPRHAHGSSQRVPRSGLPSPATSGCGRRP